MDVEAMKDFVFKHNLEERSFNAFWNYLSNYQKDNLDDFEKDFYEFNKNEIELFIDTVSLRITNWPEEGYNHVVISVRIHYKTLYRGHYTIVYSMDGEIEDDHLSLL
ncbi:hypothetical protein ACFSTH_11635 [Paenibacillus yanchengensis]|uniref:Uncharacterized protein n=1 Tax=Paenibacillus yanchengensis TaxID=2035833 RepID=A0ABW4YJ36_9BACL